MNLIMKYSMNINYVFNQYLRQHNEILRRNRGMDHKGRFAKLPLKYCMKHQLIMLMKSLTQNRSKESLQIFMQVAGSNSKAISKVIQ